MTDLTTIKTPFGLLDEATQKALIAHGGPYEEYIRQDLWVKHHGIVWYHNKTYRVRPEPTRPLVVRDWSVFADWVRFVARDSDGGVWSYSKMPGQSCVEWTKNGCCNRLAALSPTIIDPGTCEWREAICERPDEGETRILADAEALKAADALAGALERYNRSGAGPLDGWLDVIDAAAAYRKARGGE